MHMAYFSLGNFQLIMEVTLSEIRVGSNIVLNSKIDFMLFPYFCMCIFKNKSVFVSITQKGKKDQKHAII